MKRCKYINGHRYIIQQNNDVRKILSDSDVRPIEDMKDIIERQIKKLAIPEEYLRLDKCSYTNKQ